MRHDPPLWLLAALPGLGVFASSVHLPSIPAMAADLGVSTGQIQLTVTVYLAAMAACMLLVGPLSDRVGRRTLTLATLWLFFAGSLAALLCNGLEMLMAGRLVQGIGASGGVVLARSMLRDRWSDLEAARAGATMSMSIAVVPMLAPLVGGWVQQLWGWRANLALISALALALCLLAQRLLGETLPAPRRRHDLALHPRQLALGYARLFALRAFSAHALPVAFCAAAIFAYQTAAPVLLIGMLHVAPAEYGLYGAMPAAGFIVGGFATRQLAARVGRGALMQGGCLLCLGAGALMAALAGTPTPWGIAGPMILFGLGNGLVLPNGSLGSMSAAPGLIGSAAALSSGLRMGAGSLGSLLVSALPARSVFALGSLVVLGALCALLSWRALAPAPA